MGFPGYRQYSATSRLFQALLSRALLSYPHEIAGDWEK